LEEINWFGGSNEFLSNFYLCRVVYKGHEFPSSEHAYQWAKLRKEDRKKFLFRFQGGTPGQAKKLGRKYKLRPNCEKIKVEVMLDVLVDKFTRNPDLAEKLLNTGNAKLVEGNVWHDNFFGVCNCLTCTVLMEYKGENKLGKLLMAVRKMIKSGVK